MPIIPKNLDNPKRILLLPANEFYSLAIPIFIGFIGDFIFWAILVGVVLWQALKYFKSISSGFNVQNLVYWHFPQKLKKTPPSIIRRYWS